LDSDICNRSARTVGRADFEVVDAEAPVHDLAKSGLAVVTVISRFRVRNGLEKEVRWAFLNRPRLVEKAAGFCGLDVLTDAADPSVFLLLTRWTDKESFRAWHRSEAHHQSHELIPRGLKLDASFTSLTIGNSIEGPAGIQSLSDALEGQTVALSQWLMESDAVFALLLAPDGTIRVRNRAGHRLFPADPARNFGLTIWDYLVCSDPQHLRKRLSDSGGQYDGCLMLNLADGEQTPITLEVGLVRCSGAILLLGTQENRHDSHLQTEMFTVTTDLSVMMREAARTNRELKEANETIERLARTDALTGLANRRTLDEAFQREIARAERLGECLSVIIGDLDHFKSINDQYGHVTGDQVLARAAAVFGSQLRPYDLAARYGGEEFVLLLPGTSTDGAIAIAERIRKEVAEIKVPSCPRQITVSLGVASWMTGEAPEELVARADAALYNAKSTGRNRVEAATSVRV
jgi:diguanylate cyclase (GGDEF)-like protein